MTRSTAHSSSANNAVHQFNAGVSLQSLMALLGHVSAEMSLRCGRLFDATVKAEYERALTAAKAHLGALPTDPPGGRSTLPVIDGDWKQAPAVKARLAGGFCVRAQVQGPCAYANICEHCPNFRTDAGYLPVLAAQRADTEALAQHAEAPRLDQRSRPAPATDRAPRRPHPPGPSRMNRHTNDRRLRVEDACAELILAGQPVTFDDVASRTGLGRATLYRNPELRAVIEEHRARGREAHTLSGLASEIAHLRTAVETLAATVTTTNSAACANPRNLAARAMTRPTPPLSRPRLAGSCLSG